MFQKKIVVLFAIIVATVATNNTVNATVYAQNLGIGFDVTWSEFSKYTKQYTSTVPQDFAAAGFNNVRIRTNNPYPDATFYKTIKAQVTDCLNNGILPIIAYQGHIIEEGVFQTFEDEKSYLNEFWGNMTT